MYKNLVTDLRNRFGTLVRAEAKKNPKLRASDALACFDRAVADILLDRLDKTNQVCYRPETFKPLTPGRVILKEKVDE